MLECIKIKRQVGKATNKNEILSVTIKHDDLNETLSCREPYEPLIASTGGKVRIYVFLHFEIIADI